MLRLFLLAIQNQVESEVSENAATYDDETVATYDDDTIAEYDS